MTVSPVGDPDRYGRTVARVTLRDRDVAADLIAAGLAWHWTRYDSSVGYARAEAQAQRDGAGLWSDPRPVPPWEWRKMTKEERDARRSPAPANR